MKKFISAVTLAAAAAVLTVSASAAVENGIYNIDVESDSTMFKVVNCDLTVADGKLTAAVTLSGTGYGKLFVGTGEQAAAADESMTIPYTENAEGKYVYTFDIPALDEPVAVAAFSTKKGEWYDRKLTFKSDKIAAPATSDTTSTEQTSSTTNNTSSDGNPTTGAATVALTLPAAAAAIVFARKKR